MKIPDRSIPLILMIILAFAPPLAAHKARNNASVFIENLHDGAVITSPVHVSFGAQHIEIAPVGVNIHRAGHHQRAARVPRSRPAEERQHLGRVDHLRDPETEPEQDARGEGRHQRRHVQPPARWRTA